MATVPYVGVSPYVVPPIPPVEDYLHEEWLADKNLNLLRKKSGRPIFVALFGVGKHGTVHLKNLCRSRRVHVMYLVEDVVSMWSRWQVYWNLPDVICLRICDAHKVYEDPKVDAVVVAKPCHFYDGVVEKALTAKKAVFTERQISICAEDIEACYNISKDMGVPLFFSFVRRFDPSFSAVQKRVRFGEVGHVQLIRSCSRETTLYQVRSLSILGGIFHDLVIHDIDMITWILGELPSKVHATGTVNIPELLDMGDFDSVACILTFESGTIGIIDVNRFSCYGYDQRLEVFGTAGMIRVENESPIPGVDFVSAKGVRRAPIFHSFASRYKLAYKLEMENFVDAVEGRDVCKVEGYQTVAVAKIAKACDESARESKAVDLIWTDEERDLYMEC